MNLTKKRWVTLIACCLINLCLGSIYVWSVFASSMAEFLSARNGVVLTTADLAIVYTIANSVGPITMITGGWFNDKFGPKKVILIGGIMVGIGMIASGFATSVGALVVTYGLIFGLGLGMTYGTAVSSCMFGLMALMVMKLIKPVTDKLFESEYKMRASMTVAVLFIFCVIWEVSFYG